MVFGPMLVLAAGLWLFADSLEDRSAGALVCAILTLMVLGLHALISYARLELTAEGVRLRQIGMNLAAPWIDVAGLRLDRGHRGSSRSARSVVPGPRISRRCVVSAGTSCPSITRSNRR